MSSFTSWLAALPSAVLFLGFAAFGVALTLVVDVIFRRRMEDKTRTEAGRTAAIMLGVLANIYAVLIAFMLAIVVSFDHPFTGSIAVNDRPIREFLLAPSTP